LTTQAPPLRQSRDTIGGTKNNESKRTELWALVSYIVWITVFQILRSSNINFRSQHDDYRSAFNWKFKFYYYLNREEIIG
jgi:hypothetical protein